MIFFENVLRLLDLRMETPGLFGWFHILWIVLVVAGSIGLCIWHKRQKETPVRKVLLIVTLVVLVLEIYKQINYSFSYENGNAYH